MNFRLLSVIFVLCSCFTHSSRAVCTGNSLGQCEAQNPQNCPIERVVIGPSLTDAKDIQVERTSFSSYPVPFVHDGATPDFIPSTFTVTAIPSSPSDAGSSISEVDCEGSVTVFFNTSEKKTVRVEAFHRVFNRSAISSNALIITFDRLAPTIQPQQVFESAQPNLNPLIYSSGRTYYTSTDIFVTGRIVDPAPSVPSDQLSVQVIGGLSQLGQIQAQTGDAPGLYAVALGLEQETVDGEYLVELVAWDTASADGNFADGSPANHSESVIYKVVKDTAEPIMTKLEIIRNANSSAQTIREAPGVFVKRETVKVRASFSEELKAPPTLSVIQKGNGVGTPPDPYFAIHDPDLFAANPKEVTYTLTPQAGTQDIGPVDFSFQGGMDRAGNPLSTSKGILANGNEVSRAIVVDTIPPDLNRVQPDSVGVIQSIPANAEKLPRGAFPREIIVIVKDYNLPDNLPDNSGADIFARDNSSGVDFSKIFDAGTDDKKDAIRLELVGPDEKELIGTLATKPPNGLVYILPPEDELFAASPQRRAPQGNYTLKITLVDKVGNVANETFFFEVDSTNVQASAIKVAISPSPEIDDNFQPDNGNPLLKKPINGTSIPDSPYLKNLENLDSVREISNVQICSNDPSINLTRSQINLRARLNGPDTIPRVLNSTINVEESGSNGVCESVGLVTLTPSEQTDVFPAFSFNFPNPSSVGVGVIDGNRDPRFGLFDGPYIIEVIARDDAGNISEPIVKEFLLDTTPPFTRAVFPPNYSKINTPLSHFSAILEDPHPPKFHVYDEDGHINFGSGISVDFSGMTARLIAPYRQEDLDKTLFDVANGNQIKGRLAYVHRPNSFDASLPSFSAEDDFYRVLLEFIDEQGNARSLPQDGSADGIYSMVVTPVDNAGNSIDGSLAGLSGWKPGPNPDRDGPQELRKSFTFLMDTVAPNLNLNLSRDADQATKLVVASGAFTLDGSVKDLSARRDLPGSGGAGMKQVDWELVFLNPDGSLAQVSDSDEAGTNVAVKKNPIATGLAELAAIVDSSKDPSVDSSRPLDANTYKNIVLEERAWRIDAKLPPLANLITAEDVPDGALAKYFVRIYARDLAGNKSMQSVELIINKGDLSAPQLVKPEIREYLNSTAVEFEWKPIENASDYVLYISTPQGFVVTHQIIATGGLNQNVKSLQILNTNGQYQWWVKARDSAGSQGSEPLKQIFTIDTKAPQVKLVTWMDISPDTIPTITRGQFMVRIHFDGPLKDAPLVTYQPFLSSIPKQVITTSRLTENLWEGYAKIPEQADSSWDGQAILHIENARDLAGNKMMVDKSHAFEIETGPTFSIRFFENPVANSELVLIIKSSEILADDPVLSTPQNLELIGERPVKLSSRVYSTGLRLKKSATDVLGKLTIVGQDLLGNASSRIVTFALRDIDGKSGGTIANSLMKVALSPGSFEGSQQLILFPGDEMISDEDQEGPSKSLMRGSAVKDFGGIYPSSVQLIKPAIVAVRLPSEIQPKTGLFFSSVRGLEFVTGLSSTSSGEWCTMELNSLGSVHMLRDLEPPRLALPDDLVDQIFKARDFVVRVGTSDQLSGVDRASVRAHIGLHQLSTEWDSDGTLIVKAEHVLPDGDQELSLEVPDRLGNVAVLKSVVRIAGTLRMSFGSYPNPARQQATMEYRLSQSVNRVQLKVYDLSSRLVYHSNSSDDLNLALTAGTHRFNWDLENSKGVAVSNGVYLAQLLVQDQSGVAHKLRCKIAVVR